MEKFTLDESIAYLFRSLSQPERVRILLTIGEGEACVCHLEAGLGMRQAYISQHLMALREAGILTARRDGRYIFYRLAKPALLDLLQQSGELTGASAEEIQQFSPALNTGSCCCPNCVAEAGQVSAENTQPVLISPTEVR